MIINAYNHNSSLIEKEAVNLHFHIQFPPYIKFK